MKFTPCHEGSSYLEPEDNERPDIGAWDLEGVALTKEGPDKRPTMRAIVWRPGERAGYPLRREVTYYPEVQGKQQSSFVLDQGFGFFVAQGGDQRALGQLLDEWAADALSRNSDGSKRRRPKIKARNEAVGA